MGSTGSHNLTPQELVQYPTVSCFSILTCREQIDVEEVNMEEAELLKY
jgi:hypothetical protein